MATLTQAMLDDLHIGNASLSLLPYSGGVDMASGLDFSSADQIFTLENSFQMLCDDPSGTDIRIDQHRKVIDTNIERGGNWRIAGNIPSQAQALLEYFFEEGATIAAGSVGSVKGVKGTDGAFYTGKGFLATPEIIEVSILVESESKNTAILLPHVKLVVSEPKKDDNTNPLYLSFVGYILPNPGLTSSNPSGDFAVLKAATLPTT